MKEGKKKACGGQLARALVPLRAWLSLSSSSSSCQNSAPCSPHLGKVSDPDRGRVAIDLGPLVRLGVLEAVDDCFFCGVERERMGERREIIKRRVSVEFAIARKNRRSLARFLAVRGRFGSFRFDHTRLETRRGR